MINVDDKGKNKCNEVNPLPSLEEIFEKNSKEKYELTEEDRQWLNAPLVGRERIEDY